MSRSADTAVGKFMDSSIIASREVIIFRISFRTIGMMDSAYFVGRMELLDFFNSLLDLQLTKIEQTASGAVACQLTDYIYPGSIPMSKVNWEARADYEFVSNYKLLQKAFDLHKVQRHVDVDKLIRAKYQDNLEFCQWLKAFYDQSGVVREDYDSKAVRAKGKGGVRYNSLLENRAPRLGLPQDGRGLLYDQWPLRPNHEFQQHLLAPRLRRLRLTLARRQPESRRERRCGQTLSPKHR